MELTESEWTCLLAEPRRRRTVLKPRHGATQAAVLEVLARAPDPLRAVEVHAAAEALLGHAADPSGIGSSPIVRNAKREIVSMRVRLARDAL